MNSSMVPPALQVCNVARVRNLSAGHLIVQCRTADCRSCRHNFVEHAVVTPGPIPVADYRVAARVSQVRAAPSSRIGIPTQQLSVKCMLSGAQGLPAERSTFSFCMCPG